ncbi:aromatic ring-hydroxylating oxygenase subunit alpha [Elongatibacter sediminis]|uniref:Aromatic ring-hydroxylating dioxygenase subunit alpha n=1 Tax=Elongatibacter sediminis TaxID=3119006 RepID=A0AAW9R7Z9_9GAMM
MDQAFIDRVYDGIAYEQSRKGPPEDFPALPPIPGGRYTDPEFLRLEHESLWKKSWLYACHVDQVPEPGRFLLWKNTGSPIIIVRGADQAVRAFYNTCRHRGGPLVKQDSGDTGGGFTCGYHGWAYDLEGKLKGMRDRRDFVDLDFDCLGLVPVRCERLGNWVFINEDPEAAPLTDSLGPIARQMQQFDLETIRHVDTHGFEVACNVKVLLDAFLEVYHLKSIHQDTVDRFLDHRGTTIVLWRNGHSLMVTPNRRPGWVDPGTRGMIEFPHVTELPVKTNVSYNVYPNLITPVAPTGMPFINFWPISERSMYVECHWFSPDWGENGRHELWDTRINNFDRILEEDTQFAPQIQQSVESPGFRGIKLNYQERRIYHWHEELDRRIGPERIPDHLRVAPRLDGLVED